MPKQTKITVNLAGLEDLRKQLGSDYIARVGVLAGSKNARDDAEPLNNAEIGVIHEFGSDEANIPPRSFLRMPIELKGKEITKAMANSGKVKDAVESGDVKKVFALLGLKAEDIVQQAFTSGGFGQWPALQTATIRKKGSSAPLIDSGQLRRSITSDVVKRSEI